MQNFCVKPFIAIAIMASLSHHAYADTIDDPCAGPAALLNIIDRPTVSDSPCVVPYKQFVLEAGYQYQQLTHSAGHEQNYPEAEFRIGLPADNEFSVLLPNHISQSMMPHNGTTATEFGIKHKIGYNQFWASAIEALMIMPNGSAAFGSKAIGTAVNGIASYTFNPQFAVSLMLGASSETEPSQQGGERYSSINQFITFTYAPINVLNLYAEVYGQSKTSPNENSGYNMDAGIIYLLKPNLTVDIEIGQRISGNLGGINHYAGTGFAWMF